MNKLEALCEYLSISDEDIDPCTDCKYSYDGDFYIVLDESEYVDTMNSIEDNYISYLEEMVPEQFHTYLNYEKWIHDCSIGDEFKDWLINMAKFDKYRISEDDRSSWF